MQKKMNAAVPILKAALDHVPFLAVVDPFDVGYVSIEKTDYNRRFPVFSLIYLLILIYFYDVQDCCYYVDYYDDYPVGSCSSLLLLSCQMSCASCTRGRECSARGLRQWSWHCALRAHTAGGWARSGRGRSGPRSWPRCRKHRSPNPSPMVACCQLRRRTSRPRSTRGR